MSVGVVDKLEMVYVQHECAKLVIAMVAAVQFAGVHFLEPPAVVQVCKSIDSGAFLDAANVKFFFADNVTVVTQALAQYVQKVKAQIVRCVYHGVGDFRGNYQNSAFFLGKYFSTWLDVVKYGHFACTVAWRYF